MKKILVAHLFIIPVLCLAQLNTAKKEINTLLDMWHQAATDASFDRYFDLMSSDATFIGTDATENWSLATFKAYAKPHFDTGKAWSFNAVERNIYIHKENHLVWFDELLDTQMGICRGSGIVEKTNTGWKIKHYVLSIAIPNEHVKEITKLKETFDINLITKLKKKY